MLGWPSCEVATALTSGFSRTLFEGVVTKVGAATGGGEGDAALPDGGGGASGARDGDESRTILEIDSEPASAVYTRWLAETGHDIAFEFDAASGRANILGASALRPLGEALGTPRHTATAAGCPTFARRASS